LQIGFPGRKSPGNPQLPKSLSNIGFTITIANRAGTKRPTFSPFIVPTAHNTTAGVENFRSMSIGNSKLI